MVETSNIPQSSTSRPSAAPSKLTSLFAIPTLEELSACVEICRLHNDMGCWVTWIPTAWSILMVYHMYPAITAFAVLRRLVTYYFLCTGIKCVIMTIDDILDHDIDIKVVRTRNRPIPREALSLPRAWLFFALQLVVGSYCALRFVSPTSMYLAIPSVVLTMLYPTFKRWTNLAPIPLGIMFGAGTCMGWSDFADPKHHWQVLAPLYAGFCLWTITFETIYQHQDRAEDVKLGLHSMAILFGRRTILLCTTSALGFLSLMAVAGWQNGHGIAFYAGLAVAAWQLLPLLLRTDIDQPEDCKRLFLGSPLVGQAVLGGLLVDVVYHRFATGIPL